MYNTYVKNILSNYDNHFLSFLCPNSEICFILNVSLFQAHYLAVSSERSVTGNILSKQISNGLAKLISWSESEGDKTKFSNIRLCEVVFGKL